MKIGVLGAGHLGKIHIKLLKEIDEFDLVGFFDPNEELAIQVEKEFGIKRFENRSTLIEAVDALDIVTPTLSHLDCALEGLNAGKHLFIEKPISDTVIGAKQICDISAENNLKVQIGHVERFNPAFLAIKENIATPMFIESHRLAEFNPRGTDVSVVLDLMIHDIDVILSIVKSEVKDIKANGVSVLSDTPDICNARVEFDNGCVANFTASRISMKNMRKSRIFQSNAYIAVDFLEKKSEVVQMKDVEGEGDPYAMIIDLGDKGAKEIIFDQPDIQANNAILEELKSFYYSISNNVRSEVSAMDGYKALKLATDIVALIDHTVKVEHA